MKLGMWQAPSDDSASCQQLYHIAPAGASGHKSSERLLLLRLRKGEAIDSAGHIPILVGTNDDGEREFLSEYSSSSRAESDPFLHAIVGREEWTDKSPLGSARRSKNGYDTINVYVLRFDPCGELKMAIDAEGGCDASGPFFWKDWEESRW